MQIRKLFPAGAMALALVVGGCGDSTGSNSITMTQAEASVVIGDIFQSIFTAAFSATSATSLTTGVTAQCTGGGSVLVKGTDTPTTSSLTTTFSLCHGTTYIYDGTVTFTATTSGTAETTTIKGDLAITGAKSGNCHIDVTVNSNTSNSASTASGSICGVDASGVTTSRAKIL